MRRGRREKGERNEERKKEERRKEKEYSFSFFPSSFSFLPCLIDRTCFRRKTVISFGPHGLDYQGGFSV